MSRDDPRKRGGRDLVNGPIASSLLLFALPTLGSSVLQSLNGSINAIWVGRYLGEGALAATSNANLVMFLMFSAVFGFGMAATILVGQNIGRRNVDGARRAIGTAIGLLVGVSVVVATAGWLFAPALLRLLATPPEVQALALVYLRVIFLAMPGSVLSILMMMGLRGTGDSMTPLWFMALSTVIDSGLNPMLIEGWGPLPKMGIAGSATATLIATYVSAIGILVTVYARDLPIRLKGAELRYLIPARDILKLIVAKGTPMGVQMIAISVSSLTMIGLVNQHGMIVTAAYGVAMQLWTYIQMPAMSIGAAVSAMAAQNIGAGRWDRIGRITMAGVIVNLVMTGGMVLLLTLIDRPVLGLFLAADSPAIPLAAHLHLIVGWSFVAFGVMMVLFATTRANGAVLVPLLILVIALFPVRIGFALATRGWLGVEGLWWSFPAGSCAATVLAIVYYRYGKWRQGALVVPSAQEGRETATSGADATGKVMPVA